LTKTSDQKWYTLVEGRVYMSTGSGHVTTEVMQRLDEHFIAQIDASPYPLVHIIQDARFILSLPPISEVRKLNYPSHPRMGYSITVGGFGGLMRFIVSIAATIFQARSKDVNTLAEAYAYLLVKDPSLPPLNTWNLPPEETSVAS
jgi:hypothetical protein